jgi:heat shock protein HspQ
MILPSDAPVVSRHPRFERGQLVKHRRYGYRGVVVDFDLTCQASEVWYQKNQTQPERTQPWYHVLVHRAAHSTYAAQTSLLADDSGEPIEHPALAHFFTDFVGGRYFRNDEPWQL